MIISQELNFVVLCTNCENCYIFFRRKFLPLRYLKWSSMLAIHALIRNTLTDLEHISVNLIYDFKLNGLFEIHSPIRNGLINIKLFENEQLIWNSAIQNSHSKFIHLFETGRLKSIQYTFLQIKFLHVWIDFPIIFHRLT